MLSRTAAPGRSLLSQQLPYCFGATRDVPERAAAGACCRSAVCREGPAHPPRLGQLSPAETAPQPRRRGRLRGSSALVRTVSLPVALDGLKSLFLNHVCVGPNSDRRLPGTRGPWERAVGPSAAARYGVRGVCAATAARSLLSCCGACRPGVRAAVPPLASPACRQAAVGLWTGGTQSRKKHRWKMFYFSSEEGWTLELVRRWLREGFDSDILKL